MRIALSELVHIMIQRNHQIWLTVFVSVIIIHNVYPEYMCVCNHWLVCLKSAWVSASALNQKRGTAGVHRTGYTETHTQRHWACTCFMYEVYCTHVWLHAWVQWCLGSAVRTVPGASNKERAEALRLGSPPGKEMRVPGQRSATRLIHSPCWSALGPSGGRGCGKGSDHCGTHYAQLGFPRLIHGSYLFRGNSTGPTWAQERRGSLLARDAPRWCYLFYLVFVAFLCVIPKFLGSEGMFGWWHKGSEQVASFFSSLLMFAAHYGRTRQGILETNKLGQDLCNTTKFQTSYIKKWSKQPKEPKEPKEPWNVAHELSQTGLVAQFPHVFPLL